MKKIYRQIDQYLDYCARTRGMSEVTLRNKYYLDRKFAGFLLGNGCDRLEKLTNSLFDGWIGELADAGISARTINTYNASILAMVRYFRESGVFVPLKTPLVRKLKEAAVRRKFYTREQIAEVLRFADLETAVMIRICFDTGMRIAELTSLKLANFSGRRIIFVAKGHKLREAYISRRTEEAMLELVREKQVEGWLWTGENGERLTVAGVRKRLKKPFLMAGYADFYPHSLRHSFATDLELRGATVGEIRQMIGHANIATTERYLHAFDGHLAELFYKYQ